MTLRLAVDNTLSYRDACIRVRKSLEILSSFIETDCKAARPVQLDDPDCTKKDFKKYALAYAEKINIVEDHYKDSVHAAADKITQLCHSGWAEDKNIQNLWHQLAQIVTNFSEHPDNTKHVATLIIDQYGTLKVFAANRTPEGFKKKGGNYAKGRRKNFIICSERIALARYLNLRLQTRNKDLKGSNKTERKKMQERRKLQVAMLSLDIIKNAYVDKPALTNFYVLTTASPCDECATALAAHRPHKIFTCEATGNNFTRADSMQRGKQILANNHIPMIYLPS